MHVAHEAAGFLVDDRHRLRHFTLPAAPVGRAGRGQIVDAVEPHPRPAADPGIEVAGHCQIEHHQRPALAVILGPKK